MSATPATLPEPLPNDHEDVAWALRVAQAEWTSNSWRGAVRWVERAAETAEELGAIRRSVELLQLAASLSRVAGEAERGHSRPPSAADLTAELEEESDVEIEFSETDLDLDEDGEDEVDLDMDDATEVIELEGERGVTLADADVEPLDDADDEDEPLPSFEYPEEPATGDFDDRETWRPESVDAATVRPTQMSSVPARAPAKGPSAPPPSAPPPSAPPPSAPPPSAPPPSAPPPSDRLAQNPMPQATQPLRGLAALKRSPGPAVSLNRSAPIPDLVPRAKGAAPRSNAPRIGESTRAAEPMRAPEPSQLDLEPGAWIDPLAPGALAELDFDDEVPTRGDEPASARSAASRPESRYPSATPASSRPPESFRPAFPTEMGMDVDRTVPAEVAASRRAFTHIEDKNDIERELGIDLSINLKPSTPSRPAAQSNLPRRKSSLPPDLLEPFLRAPSATLPPARPIEPPSHPFQAPPPDSMREPDASFVDYEYPPEEEGPSGAMVSAPPVRPVELPPPSSLDVPLLEDASPVRQSSQAPAPVDSLAPLRPHDTVVDGVHLLEVPGLGEFGKDALALLVTSARHVRLNPGEEVNTFAAALVTRGTVQLMPTVADASCATVRKGGVIFSQGSVDPGIDLRVVGFDLGTRVVVFGKDEFAAALRMCPWVVDELRHAADSYQAMAGAVMGPLGDSFDEMFRSMVLEKLSVRMVPDGEVIAQRGKALDGVTIVGAGYLAVEGESGRNALLGPGDFVFPDTLLSGSPAPRTVRAQGNALVLFAPRAVVHELFAICPPFIELLAQG